MIGDKITLNEVTFYETLHGPMVMDTCVECGKPALRVGHTDRFNAHGLKEDTFSKPTRCSGCYHRLYEL